MRNNLKTTDLPYPRNAFRRLRAEKEQSNNPNESTLRGTMARYIKTKIDNTGISEILE